LRLRQEGEAMHAYLQNLLVRWEDNESFERVFQSPPSIPNAKENAIRFLDALESKGWRHCHRRTELNLPGASPTGTTGRADLVVWDSDTIHIVDFKNVQKLTLESAETYAQQINRYARALSGTHNAPIKGWLALLKSGVWEEVRIDV
jgi:ATP-dependent exoDNAse (exonuclease V) beta subunit